MAPAALGTLLILGEKEDAVALQVSPDIQVSGGSMGVRGDSLGRAE